MFYCYTDKFLFLEDVDLKLFDANGKLIERHRKKDLNSNIAGSGLVEDGKVYYFRLSAASYPVTVEKELVIRFKGIYQLPRFYFCQPFQSVEYTSMVLKFPTGLKVNHKLYNYKAEGKKTVAGNDEIWQWEASNIPSILNEEHSGDWKYNVPSISFNMSKFEYDGYVGDLSSWKNLGLWYNNLVGATNRLSPANQAEIKKIVVGAKDDREKIKMLYQNLQRNFRYVSIQLGIGGFKPFSADFVHEKKYGDCKGLSNYLEACLAAVGIKAYSAWIKAGKNEIMLDPDFPGDGFNHQILMVPQTKDSIWLECTSNYNDFDHLGSFTENRYALVLTENGGQLIKTPASKASENALYTYNTVNFNEAVNSEIQTVFKTSGEFKYMMHNLSLVPVDKQKSNFIRYFGMNQPDEFKIDFKGEGENGYSVTTEIFSEKGYDFKAGSKYFIKPRIYKNWTLKMTDDSSRKFDYFIDHPFVKTDTTIFILPVGVTVESLPKNRKLSFSQGHYESKYWYDEDKKRIYSTSSMALVNQQVPAEKYREAKQFFDQVIEDGNQKIILIKGN